MAPLTLITSQSNLLLRTPLLLPPQNLTPNIHTHSSPLSLSLNQNPKPFSLRLTTKRNPATLVVLSSTSTSTSSSTIPNPQISHSSPLTKTLTTIASIALLVLPKIIMGPQSHLGLVSSVGPLFFAALKDRPSGYLNTPLTVVAAGLAKWLDIYSGVLMVRVLLSWFPNIPWDRQPLSAIRDLCDPYLNLFRNIIPPIFDTLDVSPLLAFAVLGTLGSILNSSRGMY
ncbi:ylmG homolog protein 1-2, chloroplastic-like [Quercus lobata]|uniref:YGGT family protein n=1 Tax=Quercus lobata TaxID=97700 RepID=A0A7N2MFD8_QUELO|nr:ylmG homolog protein 1-2, chloroplastic-like [Quercus lobata]